MLAFDGVFIVVSARKYTGQSVSSLVSGSLLMDCLCLQRARCCLLSSRPLLETAIRS